MGYTRVLLICRPAHCLRTSDARKTSRPNAEKRLQRGEAGAAKARLRCTERGFGRSGSREHLGGALRAQISGHTLTPSASLAQPQGKRGKSMQESRTAAAYNRRNLALTHSQSCPSQAIPSFARSKPNAPSPSIGYLTVSTALDTQLEPP